VCDGQEMETVEFEQGAYNGEIVDGRPHGEGQMIFKPDDPMGRVSYQGGWKEGQQDGEGIMRFQSGDSYAGQFLANLPHGKGEFVYHCGDKEEVLMESGVRHGMSRYTSTHDGTVEDLMFWEGEPKGPSKLTYPDGSYEERSFSDGEKNGPAKLVGSSGDVFTFSYEKNEMVGPSTYTWANGQVEEATFVAGVKQGKGVEIGVNGDKETRLWKDGVLEGPASVEGANGDRLDFVYVKGIRQGAATYKFADGSVELSTFDENGEQTGPAKFTWANGAVREGNKKAGNWDGEVFYTFTEGPRAGKKDVEKWENGEMKTSQKFYGKGEQVTVENWEDLKKLEELTKIET